MSEANRAVARREVRTQMGRLRLTNAALAEKATVDVKTVNNFLGQKARWPTNVNRSRLSEALNWPPDELDYIDREGDLSPAARDQYEAAPRTSASELADEELLTELVYRMRRYRNEADGAVHSASVIADAMADGDDGRKEVAESSKVGNMQKGSA